MYDGAILKDPFGGINLIVFHISGRHTLYTPVPCLIILASARESFLGTIILITVNPFYKKIIIYKTSSMTYLDRSCYNTYETGTRL